MGTVPSKRDSFRLLSLIRSCRLGLVDGRSLGARLLAGVAILALLELGRPQWTCRRSWPAPARGLRRWPPRTRERFASGDPHRVSRCVPRLHQGCEGLRIFTGHGFALVFGDCVSEAQRCVIAKALEVCGLRECHHAPGFGWHSGGDLPWGRRAGKRKAGGQRARRGREQ